MFERMRAVKRARQWMQMWESHKTIGGMCGFVPWSCEGDPKGTAYLVMITRGENVTPLIEFGSTRDYERLREKYRGLIKERGYRGYSVGVDKVERLNVS